MFWMLNRVISEAADDLEQYLREEELQNASVLIFANKQDLPGAMNSTEISDKMRLHNLKNSHWYIQVSCIPHHCIVLFRFPSNIF